MNKTLFFYLAPIPPVFKVVVNFKLTYEVSASKQVRTKFFLSVDEVNEVSEIVFAKLRLLVNSAQLVNATIAAGLLRLFKSIVFCNI